MQTTPAEHPATTAANAEAIEAWDGPLFDRWKKYRHIVVPATKQFSDEAMRAYPPPAGGTVLDIGCGFGETTLELAELVGPEGRAVGVDASPRFVEAAAAEAREAGVTNVRFDVVDVEQASFEDRFDLAFSRMGTMFFANPVAALRRVREALVPGGRLVMVVWRSKEENEWLHRAQLVVERFVRKPDEYEEPTCGPGPFSMANADTTSGILLAAGFEDPTLRRCDRPYLSGRTIDEAVEIVMDIGPAGEILRLQGDRAAHLHEPIRQALSEDMEELLTDEGVVAPASTWIVTATAPA